MAQVWYQPEWVGGYGHQQCTVHVQCPKEQTFRLQDNQNNRLKNLNHPNESRIMDSEGPMFYNHFNISFQHPLYL
jgi:hypothetical protein